jgi:hypothetical protein
MKSPISMDSYIDRLIWLNITVFRAIARLITMIPLCYNGVGVLAPR